MKGFVKTITSIVIVFLFITNSVFSQWQQVYPNPEKDIFLRTIYFTDSSTGYGINDNGSIVKTNNGGSSWHEIYINNDNGYLNVIKFVNFYTGFAAGENGLLLKTSDSGNSWHEIAKLTDENLREIEILDSANLRITGWTDDPSNRTKLLTTNMGETWTIKKFNFPDSVSYTLKDTVWYSFTSQYINNLYLLTLHKSTDEGQSWRSYSWGAERGYTIAPENQKILSVIDSLNIWAFYVEKQFDSHWGILSFANIIKTADGGKTWERQYSPSNIEPTSIKFLNALQGLAIGLNGLILKTSDGGKTWIRNADLTNQNLYYLQFTDQQNGYILGENSTLLKTTDSGMSWQVINVENAKLNSRLNSITFLDSSKGFAAGEAGTLLKTTDSGNSWTRVQANSSSNLKYFHFIDSSLGYIFSAGTTVLKTMDGGISWTVANSMDGKLQMISFGDKLTGYAITNFKDYYQEGSYIPYWALEKSTDGGNNWTTLIKEKGNNFVYIYFISADSGFMAVQNGDQIQLLQTSDGAKTWQEINFDFTNSGIPSYNFSFSILPDSRSDFLFITDTRIVKTSDFGKTWTNIYNGNNSSSSIANLSPIVFNSRNIGYSVGAAGLILKTTDGANSWKKQESRTAEDLTSFCFSNATTGFAVGNKSIILRNFTAGLPDNAERPDTADHSGGFFPDTTSFHLAQNYPNSFSSSTTISYFLKENTHVELIIYDQLGKEVKTIINEYQQKGTKTIAIKLSDLSSGIYFYKLKTNFFSNTRKMLLVK